MDSKKQKRYSICRYGRKLEFIESTNLKVYNYEWKKTK